MVPIAETELEVREEEHVASAIEPTSPPLKALAQTSPEKVSVNGAPTETAPEMSVEGCFKKDLTEIARMEKVVGNLEKDLAMTTKIERSLEMATPAWCFLASTSPVGPSNPMLRAPFAGENLQSMVEYLRNLLPPVERLFLNEQKGKKQSVDALRFFVHVGQCLASLTGSNVNVPSIEKEEIDLLKHRLEHLEKNNT